jgi:PAS domain S-box-containing protein
VTLHCADQTIVNDIVLAIEEACTNAIRHSGSDADIEILLAFEDSHLRATVKDRGRGFDVDAFDPKALPDPLLDHGRGLFLISRLCDEMKLRRSGGIEVTLVKKVVGYQAAQSLESGIGDIGTTSPSARRDSRARAMLEEIDEGFFALDWEYRYVFANRAALKITQTSLEDLLGHTPWELFPDLQGGELETKCRQAMELGRPSVLERPSILTGDWYEVRIYPTPAGISVYYREINERKRIEAERERLLQTTRLLLEAATVGASMLDLDQMLGSLAELLLRSSDHSRVLIELWDDEHEEVDIAVTRGTGAVAAQRLEFDDVAEAVRQVTSTRQTTVVDYTEIGLPGPLRHVDRHAFLLLLVVPIIHRERLVGLIVVDEPGERRPFGSEEIELVEAIAGQAAAAIANAQLIEREVKASRFEASTTWSRTTRLVDRLRRHPWGVLAGCVVIEAAILVALDAAYDTRHVLGLPGSMMALVAVFAGALAGPLIGALVALAAGVAFYATVADFGGSSTAATTAISTAIWLSAGLLSGLLATSLREQTERRRMAAVALARTEAASEAQRAEQARIEELATGLQAQADALEQRADFAEALNVINRLVHSTLDFEEVMQRALDEGVRALAADASTIERREQSFWIVAAQCGLSGTDVGLRQSEPEAPNATRAAESREPLATADVTADPALTGSFVRERGLRAVLAVPLIAHEQVIGCLLIYQREVRAFGDLEIDFARKLAATVSLAMENTRLAAADREATRFSAALNEINAVIHSTLRVEEIMQRVVAAALGVVGADSAMVAVKHGDDWVAEYGHPEVPGVIHESVRSDEAPFMIMAVTERRPVAIDDCESDVRCIPEVQRRFGVRSVLCVPLIAHDEVFGVIFFNHHRQAVPFSEQTVDFAAKLAAAISSALENARLYEEQRRIATTLQESFLHPLPSVAGLELGMVTQTAFEPELIGGDFSDVFLLADGQVAILIGDVAGKGVRAAGLTETVRSTARAFAAIDSSPAFVLGKTNEALLRYEPDESHVTAFLCVLDLRTGHLSFASAGHPPPVHLGPFSCAPLGVVFGPPLGTFESPHTNAHVMLTLEDYLVLYTDGVTEARRHGELFGEQRLNAAVASLRGASAQQLAEGVRDSALAFATSLRDDLLVVAMRLG